MQVRLLDGTYAPQGMYWEEIQESSRVDFGDPASPHYLECGVSSFVLLSSLSTAFVAHYNAPKFYKQMRKRSPRRFAKVVVVAFTTAGCIYIWVACCGYLTFGKHAQGLILNNYSEHDPWAMGARVAIGIAVLFGFPLSFTALRDSTISTFNLPSHERAVFYGVTFALLVPITVLGCVLNDLGLVNTLGGAIFGALITLIFPGLLSLFAANLAAKKGSSDFGEGSRLAAWVMLATGVVLLPFGSAVTLISKFHPQWLHRS